MLTFNVVCQIEKLVFNLSGYLISPLAVTFPFRFDMHFLKQTLTTRGYMLMKTMFFIISQYLPITEQGQEPILRPSTEFEKD